MPDDTDVTQASPSTGEAEAAELERKEAAESRKDLFRALGLCLIAVLVVRSFLFEPFKIPSSSMVPTLKIGDHIFVSKFSYGLSLPFSKIEFVRWGEPQRGDIIVFLFPRDESLHYIKRVVGVPGDLIEFRGKDVIVNGEPLPKDLVADPKLVQEVVEEPGFAGELFKERIGTVAHYVKYSARTAYEFSRNSGPQAVPEDQYFVVGDNRDDSYDSRSWGFVPRENIKGKAQVIWMSLDQGEAWGKLNKVRWNRCGTLIH
jgi:signal peptidase I